MVLSELAEAKVLPLGLKATLLTLCKTNGKCSFRLSFNRNQVLALSKLCPLNKNDDFLFSVSHFIANSN